MPNMLALVACVEPHEGVWLKPQGREAGVKLYPELGQGESVIIELDDGIQTDAFVLDNGFNSLPELANTNRFRVVKTGSGTPTNVEVVRNGKAQRENRDALNPERPERHSGS